MNRFGFALEGAWCAADRIYYDSLNGQLKTSDPKWEGFNYIKKILLYLDNFCNLVDNDLKNLGDSSISEEDKSSSSLPSSFIKNTKMINSLKQLFIYKTKPNQNSLDKYLNEDDFKQINNNDNFLDEFHYYAYALKASLKILAMIYYCLLLIAVTGAGVSMMFYACLKRQGYLITIMHVLWNVIRFFMFSFFLYGTAYGIFFLVINDSIALIMHIFNENLFLSDENEVKLIGNAKTFLKFCLKEGDNNFKNVLDETYTIAVNDFFNNYIELKKNIRSIDSGIIKNNIDKIDIKINTTENNEKEFNFLISEATKRGGLFSCFDCGFLKSDLQHLYRTLYDASIESRILCALSLCSAFFGAVAVYFYLLVMHHYNNELFFDSGKSIFTGFDGFGSGYKRKNHNQDPSYKKRKLRAEIELTSKNDDQDEYKDINKNEDD